VVPCGQQRSSIDCGSWVSRSAAVRLSRPATAWVSASRKLVSSMLARVSQANNSTRLPSGETLAM
jgi:hypothetical protein